MIEIGSVFKYKLDCMKHPEFYFIVNLEKKYRYGVDYYTLCRTDFKLRGPEPSMTDLWMCREEYINEMLKNGEMERVYK